MSTDQRIRKLFDCYNQGLIPTLKEHEVNPGLSKNSRENYLYFTLPPCINFQRNSPAMWKAALETFNDPRTNYLFFPEKTANISFEQIQKDLVKHKLALQKNVHTKIWIKISETLNKYFQSDPRNMFEINEFDVVKIKNFIQIEKPELFPHLRGPKMTNYWLYIVSKYTDAPLKNLGAISIIPDTHVIQSTIKLGLCEEGLSNIEVAKIWETMLLEIGISPVEMHPVLWNWSRNNFLPEV